MIEWNESYATGEERLDSDHKMLFAFINDLSHSIEAGKPVEEFKGQLGFLANYAKSHFCYEENCMEKHQCPVAEKNKDAHAKFIEFYEDFATEVKDRELTLKDMAELHHFIEVWIVSHIQTIDAQIKPCLSEGS